MERKARTTEKASQYQLEEMRNYGVMHTHAYWLKVQQNGQADGEHDQQQKQPLSAAHSEYCLN